MNKLFKCLISCYNFVRNCASQCTSLLKISSACSVKSQRNCSKTSKSCEIAVKRLKEIAVKRLKKLELSSAIASADS